MKLLRFLEDNIEDLTFWSGVLATVLGLVVLLLVCFRWSWLGRFYREFWAKCVVAVFRAGTAGAAIAARAAPTRPDRPLVEQPWAATVLIATIGYFLWETAGAYGDHKYKQAKEKTAAAHQQEIEALQQAHAEALTAANQEVVQANQDREDAEFEATRHGVLLTMLRESVGFKRQRIRRVAAEIGGARASLSQARAGLGSREQVRILLEALAALLRLQAVQESGDRHNQNFRIGLVAEQGGRLAPLAAFDLATKSHEPFSSYTTHAERYQLNNDKNPSHAVRCVRAGQVLIVADCAAEPGFYFHERQPNYLKSLVAYPIVGFCPDGVTPARAALLIDTDVPGFFNEDDREMLELLLREFVARIDLEYAISGLTG